MRDKTFSAEKRARYLAFRQAGMSNAEACAATPVSRQTVAAWASRGRGPNARTLLFVDPYSGADTNAERDFAKAFDGLPATSNGASEREAAPLEPDDLIDVLEAAARRGNATAAARLLRRAEREERGEEEPGDDDDFLDIFASDPNDALYDPEIRRRVIEQNQRRGRR
jgi:hypothetical protein